MAFNMQYPSPTALGIGRLVLANGEDDGTLPPPPAPPEEPQAGPKRNFAFAIPKAPAVSLGNGDDYKNVLIKEKGHGVEIQ